MGVSLAYLSSPLSLFSRRKFNEFITDNPPNSMLSNGTTSTFWLLFHTLQSPDLLSAARAELKACRISPSTTHTTNTGWVGLSSTDLNTSLLVSQPLLQSLYAETLRKYISVYLTRRTEFAPVRILDYFIPQNRTIVVNSAMAHMDPANFNEGAEKRQPVTRFWGERFLLPGKLGNASAYEQDPSPTHSPGAMVDEKEVGQSTFSLDKYKGAWIPFGGGAHQCPGRHWVKVQMVVSLALFIKGFEIELLDQREGQEVKVDMRRYGMGALEPGERVRGRVRRR